MVIHSSASGVLVCLSTYPLAQKPHHYRGFTITITHTHTHTHHSVGLLWTSYQPDAYPSTWQHSTLKIPRRDSNPQSREAKGWRLTPSAARPLDVACHSNDKSNTVHLECYELLPTPIQPRKIMPYTYDVTYTDKMNACVRERLELSCKHASELVCDSQNDEPENSTEERHKSAEKFI